ncbi:hypothetical protein [Streptomyces globisporus]|uniref:hypothetical protein n=1 Tax=Streptomyces globisporus TaxID=1908 RepID=UPI0037BD9DB1
MLATPALRQLFLAYDQARDLDADNSRVDALADRIVEATLERYGHGRLPKLDDGISENPALIQGTANASSPTWRRLDSLIRARLGR